MFKINIFGSNLGNLQRFAQSPSHIILYSYDFIYAQDHALFLHSKK